MTNRRGPRVLALLSILLTCTSLGSQGAHAATRLRNTTVAQGTLAGGPAVLSPVAMSGIRRSNAILSLTTSLDVNLRSTSEARVAMEFDVRGITGPAPFTTLGLWLEDLDPGGSQGSLIVSYYVGNGSVTTADFFSGAALLTQAHDSPYEILNLDVTTALQTALNAGASFLGFRVSTTSSDRYTIRDYQLPRLTIGGPTTFVPVATALSPIDNVAAGSAGMSLDVIGNNFAPNAVVQWNGSDRPTTFSYPERLSVDLPAGDLAVAGVASITVVNPGPAGGVSAPLPFTVRARMTYVVDDDAPGDPGPNDPNVSDPLEDGSEQHPFDTVQEALGRSFAEDTVRVLSGTYVEDLTATRDGGALIGSGAANTLIRSRTGALLTALADPTSANPLRLRLQDVTLVGGTIAVRGHVEFTMQEVEVRGGALQLGHSTDFAAMYDLEGVTMDGGTISLSGAPGTPSTPLSATVANLHAPATQLDFNLADPAGYSSLVLKDSEVAGLYFHAGLLSGGATSLTVSRVWFASDGLRIRVSDDQGYQATVEDSFFTGAGIQIEHPLDLEGRGGHLTVVRRCRLDGGNLEFLTDAGNFAMRAEANRFVGGGLLVRWTRTSNDHSFSETVTAINNVFENSAVAIDALYAVPYDPADCPGPACTGSYHLQAYNNTIVGAHTGIHLQAATAMVPGDSIAPDLINNIVASGAEGIRVDGLDPEWVSMFTNDIYDNSGGNYLGLADRTGLRGNLSLDPLFVGPGAGDFHLAAGSPCIDTGLTLLGIVTADFDGRPRPLRGRVEGNATSDIGAFEFVLAPPGGGGLRTLGLEEDGARAGD